MAHRDRPGIIAPHIPADAYRRAEATGQTVVIVVHSTDQNRRPIGHYLFPIVIAGAGVVGVFGLVAAFMALLDFAVHTAIAIGSVAGPVSVGGITLKLARPKD
ncbi:hypothetical protein [Streptomyces sp. NBC_00687]|uniref:hypothetical protein n=1 Tax=Streptomyces sp. NBC_00687 TaxID=2975807 RepID=UPI0022548DA7|nr:hypothetical protein [Streptomyces sp. NBC_00687]MCX4914357.1 hypothetical protein [Streptomyces sp. NBC_00687]